MGVPNATKYASINAVAALATYVSLHTAAGGTTGASEASGGSYARQQTTWPSNANPSTGSPVNVPAPAGTYVEFGLWSAVTAGTFGWSVAFTGGNVIVSGTGASITVTPSLAA